MNNPIIRAFFAAYGELTTPEAIQWYRETAHQTYLVVSTLAVLVYCLVEDYLLEITELPAEAPPLDAPKMSCLPVVAIAGLLPPTKPVTRVTAPILPSSGVAIIPPVVAEPEADQLVVKPPKRTRKPKALATATA